jgi:CPA1 family monovalent cation:H+ antiporter
VLFTLVFQGLTVERLIRRLGLATRQEEILEQQRRQARLFARRSGIDAIRRLRGRGVLPGDLASAMIDLYQMELDREEDALRQHVRAHPELQTSLYLQARADTLRAERRALQEAARTGVVGDEVLAELTNDVNDHLAAIEFLEEDARQGEIMAGEDEDDG